MSNENLNRAKKRKNDNFFTRLEDIEAEILEHKDYIDYLENKVVYMNCDHPDKSNFWKFFKEHFNEFKLKKIICTHYIKEGQTFKTEYDGAEEKRTDLICDGDFRSDECIEILRSSDIVITNPPFSLWREFIKKITDEGKQFLIVGALASSGCKEIFKEIRDDKIKIGFNKLCNFFDCDDNIKNVVTCCWYTTLKINRNIKKLKLNKKYEKNEYQKYDNYDAINVDRLKDIPMDYDGVMGVPITILYYLNPEQFEIVAFRKGDDGKDLVFSREREREREYNRTTEYLFDSEIRINNRSEKYNMHGREKQIQQNGYKEKIDYLYPSSTPTPALLNSSKLSEIKGKGKYIRILVRHKKK